MPLWHANVRRRATTTLKPGRCRYGLMLREDGYIYDDGVVARLADDRYHVTTTTGGAPRVYRHMFEINVPAHYGRAVWETLFEAGQQYEICPYGTETMHVLRAEKGFIIVGQDTDGTVTPHDAGMSWAVAKKKKDFVGMRSLARPDLIANIGVSRWADRSPWPLYETVLI